MRILTHTTYLTSTQEYGLGLEVNLFRGTMKQTLNIRNMAKKVVDLSHIAWEAGFPFNNVGNFSLLPLPDGNGYFAYVRVFGYWIDGKGRYLTNNRVLLKHPSLHLFVLLDKNFNFVRRFRNTASEYFKLK